MSNYFSFGYMLKTFPVLLESSYITLLIAVVAFFLGMILALIGAIIIINNIFFLKTVVNFTVSFIRGTPELILLFLAYLGLPEILTKMGLPLQNLPSLFYIFFVFVLYFAANAVEIVRAAILSVPVGQLEAGLSIGMKKWQCYCHILIPQALYLAMGGISNILISTLKATSIIFNVGVVEVMRKAMLLGSNSRHYTELFLNVAIIYCIFIYMIAITSKILENKLGKKYAIG